MIELRIGGHCRKLDACRWGRVLSDGVDEKLI